MQQEIASLTTERDALSADLAQRTEAEGAIEEIEAQLAQLQTQRDEANANVETVTADLATAQTGPAPRWYGVNLASAEFAPHKLPGVAGQGSILVLTMEERDYSLSQISRYVEENNAKILSAHVIADEHDPYRIRLTLRLNTDNLARIKATLERFSH